MLIVLSGLPGVGKTTIARALAAELQAVHVRIDSIEHALRNAGWNIDSEGYRVAYAVAEDSLRLGRIVVADIVGHRLPTWADVIERDYRPWDVDRFVVDTARLNVQQSVQTILSAISA